MCEALIMETDRGKTTFYPFLLCQTFVIIITKRYIINHYSLTELEETRDEVLVEVHKMEKTNSTSKKEAHVRPVLFYFNFFILSTYFIAVFAVSCDLCNIHAWVILDKSDVIITEQM